MNVLVTGGAGYIGANLVRMLRFFDHDVVVLDDLSTGRRDRLPKGVPLIHARCDDIEAVHAAMSGYRVTSVVHLAGLKSVHESTVAPLWYYQCNLRGTRVVLDAMVHAGVRNIVFASSAAVYGRTDQPAREERVCDPTSPYGRTKLVSEWMLADAAKAHDISAVALRLACVAGADHETLGDRSPYNLFPATIRSLVQTQRPRIYGGDYATVDGSALRDYVHVTDVAAAFVAALDRAQNQPLHSFDAYNIGTGLSTSVWQVMKTFSDIVGFDVNPDVRGLRGGDAPVIVLNPYAAKRDLEWTPRYGLRDMVISAWQARSSTF